MADSTTAINLTLINEGGFQKDEDDSGNWTGGAKGVGELKGTKYGISAHEFPDLDIENITQDQADDIYRNGRPPQVPPYWHPLYDQIESQPVANKLFDLGVLFGRGSAIKSIQGIVKSIQGIVKMVQDGSFGPHTLVAINESDPTSLLGPSRSDQTNQRMRHFLKPEEIAEVRAKNAKHLDLLVLSLPQRCGNPYCRLPIPINHNFRLLDYGDVCELCYALYHILSEQSYWNAVQNEATQKRKKDDEGFAGFRH
jgi:hypothetical protein